MKLTRKLAPIFSRRNYALFDRRTVVTLLVSLALFILAFRGIEAKAAIESMAFVTVALIAGNASQRALIAWSGRGRDSLNKVKPKEKDNAT